MAKQLSPQQMQQVRLKVKKLLLGVLGDSDTRRGIVENLQDEFESTPEKTLQQATDEVLDAYTAIVSGTLLGVFEADIRARTKNADHLVLKIDEYHYAANGRPVRTPEAARKFVDLAAVKKWLRKRTVTNHYLNKEVRDGGYTAIKLIDAIAQRRDQVNARTRVRLSSQARIQGEQPRPSSKAAEEGDPEDPGVQEEGDGEVRRPAVRNRRQRPQD